MARSKLHFCLFAVLAAWGTPAHLSSAPAPRVEIQLLSDLAKPGDRTLLEERLLPSVTRFLDKWAAQGLSLSGNRLVIVVEPNGTLLKEKGLSGFYGPTFAPALAALSQAAADETAADRLLSEAKLFALAFPPLLRREILKQQSLEKYPELVADLNRARKENDEQIKFVVKAIRAQADSSLGSYLHEGGQAYFSALDVPGSGFVFIGSSDAPGEYDAAFKNTDVVFHELFHGLLHGIAPTIAHYRSLNEVLADVAAQTELNDPCCLHFFVPGKQNDFCLRHMQRPSEPLADALWSRGGNAGEYGDGQSLRRFFWDLYLEVGKAKFAIAFSTALRGLERILRESRLPNAFFDRAVSDPFVEEYLDQRQYYRAAKRLLGEVCATALPAKVCERRAEYLGTQDDVALELVQSASPSAGQAVHCAETNEDGSFYYDKKESRWGLRLGTTSFYPLSFSVDEKTHSVSLEYRADPRVLHWTSRGKLEGCR